MAPASLCSFCQGLVLARKQAREGNDSRPNMLYQVFWPLVNAEEEASYFDVLELVKPGNNPFGTKKATRSLAVCTPAVRICLTGEGMFPATPK